MNKRILRVLALALCCLLLPAMPVVAENAAFAQAPGEQNHIVRVLLSQLGVTDRLDLTLDGVYSVGNKNESSMVFARGSELTVLLQGGSLIVHYKGMMFNAGSSVYLTRYADPAGEHGGLRLQTENGLYPGDLELQTDGSSIKPILHIAVEDYLLGVLPYEMSDDFPLEALKAQAVTARTYALSRINPDKPYDMVDTTNDQVFKGIREEHDRSRQAVEETRGLCGFYKGKLAECFYSASNGGQTDLVAHVWPNSGDYGYYDMRDDPYDLENPQSLVKRAMLPKKGLKADASTHALRAALAAAMEGELLAQGYDATADCLRVDSVSAVSVDTPAHKAPSRVMTRLHITLTYSARKRIQSPAATVASNLPTMAPDSDVMLFSTAAPALPTAPSPSAEAPFEPPIPTPTPAPRYGEYEPHEGSVTVTLPIFPDALAALALSLNSYDNELLTVVEKDNAFVIESRRYGHGLGMSQRGAEQMAGAHGMSYLDILGFYYPGMTLQRYAENAPPLPMLDEQSLATPGPRPTPTPRPTLIPVTGEAPQGAWYAIVTGIEDDSTLNLRSAPNLSGEILTRLMKYQRLLVLETCEEGWVRVKTDAIEGFVMQKYLTSE